MFARLKSASLAAALLGAMSPSNALISIASAQAPAPGTIQPVSGSKHGSPYAVPSYAPPGCATPYAPVQPVIPPVIPDPVVPPPTQTPTAQAPFGDVGTTGSDTTALAAPNMLGDLLFGSRSVRFGFTRTDGDTNFFDLASTTVVNASVAENNSPIPQDRVYLRYNYFSNAQSVTGISPERVVIDPGVPGVVGPVFLQLSDTRDFDVHQYTLGFEKTFLDGMMSVEMRLPLRTGLSSRNTLSVGNIGDNTVNSGPGGDATLDAAGNTFFLTTVTPENTLGQYATEFGNMSLFLKALLYTDPCSRWAVSGGLGMGIPTGRDTNIRVVDFASTGRDVNRNLTRVNSAERLREIEIENETWSLTPYLAAVILPSDRLFTQGFLSVDVPLNKSGVTYNDQFTRGNFQVSQLALDQGSLRPPFTAQDTIREQTLLHLDWSVGYWLMRNPTNRWLTGIAPSLELHYTTTLNDADIRQLPGNAALTQFDPRDPLGAFIRNEDQVPEVGPVVGSQRNRVDILNMTVGSTFEIANRATLATGVAFPLRGGDNRTFDWELQIQFNYYFGGR